MQKSYEVDIVECHVLHGTRVLATNQGGIYEEGLQVAAASPYDYFKEYMREEVLSG